MSKLGYLKVTENGGDLWRLHRGDLVGHVITAVEIDTDGLTLWIKTEKPEAKASAPHKSS